MFETRVLTPDDERELATVLAKGAAEVVAPAELLLFDEIAAAYWKEPEVGVRGATRPEAVGFGIDAALMTPLLLAVAMPVIKELAAQIGTAIKEKAGGPLAALVRQALGLPAPAPGDAADAADAVPALTREQLDRLRNAAVMEARRLGVEEPTAAVLADAITGRVAVQG